MAQSSRARPRALWPPKATWSRGERQNKPPMCACVCLHCSRSRSRDRSRERSRGRSRERSRRGWDTPASSADAMTVMQVRAAVRSLRALPLSLCCVPAWSLSTEGVRAVWETPLSVLCALCSCSNWQRYSSSNRYSGS